MKQSIKLFSYRGIPVFVHWSFGLIIFYILYIAYTSNLDFQGTSWLTLTFLTFFGCVIFHEFGHALMARKFGIGTKDIVLTPIGGVARLLRMPKSPKQEFYVAIAGPAVNIFISLILGLFLFEAVPELLNRYDPIDINRLSIKEFIFVVFIGNIFLAMFNLLPAFPMDGGRILRALLSVKLSRKKATQWASWIGRIFALGFIIYGLYSANYILAFIGVFVFFSAGMEYRQLELEERLQHQKVSELFTPEIKRIFHNQALNDIDLTNSGEKDFLVFNQFNNLIGLLSPKTILHTLKENPLSSVRDLMRPVIIPISKEDLVQKALYLMQSNSIYTLPVYDDGLLIGTIDYRDIMKK